MKKINLDSSTAKQELEEVKEGALFKCVTQIGRESKWFTGYFSSDTGVFWMAQQQEGGFRLSQSDAEELVDYAIGNISEAECSWYEPEPEQEDDSVHFSHSDYLNNYKMPRERTAWRKMQ